MGPGNGRAALVSDDGDPTFDGPAAPAATGAP